MANFPLVVSPGPRRPCIHCIQHAMFCPDNFLFAHAMAPWEGSMCTDVYIPISPHAGVGGSELVASRALQISPSLIDTSFEQTLSLLAMFLVRIMWNNDNLWWYPIWILTLILWAFLWIIHWLQTFFPALNKYGSDNGVNQLTSGRRQETKLSLLRVQLHQQILSYTYYPSRNIQKYFSLLNIIKITI